MCQHAVEPFARHFYNRTRASHHFERDERGISQRENNTNVRARKKSREFFMPYTPRSVKAKGGSGSRFVAPKKQISTSGTCFFVNRSASNPNS